MSITAMKQALEALEAALSDDKPYIVRSKEAITALRAAISEQEKCDHVPVTTFGGDYCIKCDAPIESNDYPVPAAAGWQLLPKEPTEAMLEAAFVYLEDADFVVAGVWQAMLQAAPKPGENHD